MPTQAVEYAVGEVLVEPVIGLFRIVGSQPETILGVEHQYYELLPHSGGNSIKVPAGQMDSRGVRAPMTSAMLDQALSVTADDSQLPRHSSERIRHWREKLRSGAAEAGVQVLRQIARVRNEGNRLAPAELALQDRVRTTVSDEIALVYGITSAEAGELLLQATTVS